MQIKETRFNTVHELRSLYEKAPPPASPEEKETKINEGVGAAYLIRLPDAAQGDPQGSHHGVPDEPLVPHLHGEAQIQPVYLTAPHMEGRRHK